LHLLLTFWERSGSIVTRKQKQEFTNQTHNMGKSQETWNKKETEKKKQKKRQDKEQKKEERRANAKESSSLDDMLAYVDENGNISSTPPDPNKKRNIREEDIQIGVPKQGNVKMDIIRKGIVTFFNDSKGYGFIKDSETQESVFVHINGLIDPIKENNKVIFEVEMGHKGPNAVTTYPSGHIFNNSSGDFFVREIRLL
jgi:cold shock CspA family protein